MAIQEVDEDAEMEEGEEEVEEVDAFSPVVGLPGEVVEEEIINEEEEEEDRDNALGVLSVGGVDGKKLGVVVELEAGK